MKRSHSDPGSAGSRHSKRVASEVNRRCGRSSVARLAGTRVLPHVRTAGHFLIGPKLCGSPVKSITHYLGRRDGTDKYFLLKILSLTVGGKESQDERQGKMLLHTEHSLLSLLQGVAGVVQCHHTFMDTSLQEEEGRYTGRRVRRVVLVLDCLVSHDFSTKTRDMINLQHHVIREKKLSEKESLVIFHSVVTIVCRLHKANIVHRDLKLGNIVLDKRSNKVTITNFCLGKHLMSDNDLLKDQRGSPAYISPDVLSNKPYQGKPSDMWALGVVMFTMLYGQFPFYDSAPQELFNKIKSAEFTIPEDGRVSEDTVSVIRRLLVTDPAKRLTAEQVLGEVERIILMWRNIAPGDRAASSQVVPEWSGDKSAAADTKADREKEKRELSHECVLRNLAHGRETVVTGLGRKSGGSRLRGSSLPVHRLGEDARPLTGEEYRLYSGMITELRQSDRHGHSSSSSRHRDRAIVSSVAATQVLVRPDRLLRSQAAAPAPALPLPASLVSLPATVPDQTEVLDLSSSARRPPDQTAPAPAPPAAAPAGYAGSGVNTTPAHSRRDRQEADTSSPLSLVGALRRLGTNVNLVPVNFSMTSRSRSHSPSTVTVTRAETDTRHPHREQRSPGPGPSIVTVSHRWSHEHGHRAHRAHGHRASDSRAPGERERHRHEHRHHRSASAAAASHAVIERLGSSSRHSHGVAMPLAEATRLLNNSWDTESVRQADMFINSLAVATSISSSTSSNSASAAGPATAAAASLARQHSSPAAGGEASGPSEYYNPAVPTEDSTDSSDSNTPATS